MKHLMRFSFLVLLVVVFIATVCPVADADSGPEGTLKYEFKIYDDNKEVGEDIFIYFVRTSSDFVPGGTEFQVLIQEALEVKGCSEPCIYMHTLSSRSGVQGAGFWATAKDPGEYVVEASFTTAGVTEVVTDTLSIQASVFQTEFRVSSDYIQSGDYVTHWMTLDPTVEIPELTVWFGKEGTAAQMLPWSFFGAFERTECYDWTQYGYDDLVRCQVFNVTGRISLSVPYQGIETGRFTTEIHVKQREVRELPYIPLLYSRKAVMVGFPTYFPFMLVN